MPAEKICPFRISDTFKLMELSPSSLPPFLHLLWFVAQTQDHIVMISYLLTTVLYAKAVREKHLSGFCGKHCVELHGSLLKCCKAVIFYWQTNRPHTALTFVADK